MPEHVTTHADFENESWHDNYLYGLSIDVGDIEADDWRAELVLDIDHITEWVKGADGAITFLVAPATLVFHDVTDLKLNIDWGRSGHQTALHEASIGQIEREQVADQKICLDRPYYSWRIVLNWPHDGMITFGASGYTQKLRKEPFETEQQKLAPGMRTPSGSAG